MEIRIEEDIKRCEKLTEPQNANWIGISNQLAIAGALARIKELEEENKLLLNGKVGVDLSYDDYIPKQKVKDKINKLNIEWEKEIKNSKTLTSQRRLLIAGQCAILTELLEDK